MCVYTVFYFLDCFTSQENSLVREADHCVVIKMVSFVYKIDIFVFRSQNDVKAVLRNHQCANKISRRKLTLGTSCNCWLQIGSLNYYIGNRFFLCLLSLKLDLDCEYANNNFWLKRFPFRVISSWICNTPAILNGFSKNLLSLW